MEYENTNPEYLLPGVRILRANRQPCIVCGHPTGDCATEHSRPSNIIGFGTIPSMEKQQEFLVEEDVVVEQQITPFTRSKVILARKGQKIPLARARELGLF
jgi:hypothetical protein